MPTIEQDLPVAGGDAKRRYVQGIFGAIAPRYDLLNHLLSLNADRRWRRVAIDRLDPDPAGRYLDLCAGTLDLAAELANRTNFSGDVVAADFVPAMLRRGRGKSGRVRSAAADALQLPFADAQFDGATVGFGVRNLMDLDAGLREAARVLKPGAKFVILEFTTPTFRPLRALYLIYLRGILPRIGRLMSKHTDAYDWLPASIASFPDPRALASRLTAAGFTDATWETLWGGIVALHVATRSAG